MNLFFKILIFPLVSFSILCIELNVNDTLSSVLNIEILDLQEENQGEKDGQDSNEEEVKVNKSESNSFNKISLDKLYSASSFNYLYYLPEHLSNIHLPPPELI